MKLHRIPLYACLLVAFPALAQSEGSTLGEVSVTATREARLIAETPASIGTVKEATVLDSRAGHPSQLLNQVAGVWVSNLSGEGHSTSIRQPLTTGAVYLYLEDGVPTRSTGFFNHNAMYEINVPQSGGIEVLKGPGSALYGSDAIGGTVNVLTRTPPRLAEFDLTGEIGTWGWSRIMASGGNTSGDNAFRASVNLTRTDGWHEQAGYDRQTGTLRWDRALATDSTLKTVFSFSQVNQKHVGGLSQGEYDKTPQRNNIPFSFRKVEAFRLSTAYEKETTDSLLSVTGYLRKNSMDIIPSWTVSYDPNQYLTENTSIGLLAKYRLDFSGPLRPRMIVGTDIDYSPGSRREDSIRLTSTATAEGGTSYAINSAVTPVRIYDYDVTYRGISPYLHGEISPSDKLRLTAGLRYDDMQYDYKNNFNGGAATATQGVLGGFPAGGWFGHVASTRVGYTHWGPKLGATYAFAPSLSGFANYANSFRAPSEGQVFRGNRESTAIKAQTAAESLLKLKPVIVDNYEIGLRGNSGSVNWDIAAYHMTKKDDIVSYTDPATTQRTVVNAGKTLHRGIESSIGAALTKDWRIDLSLSYAKHTYEKWVVSGTVDNSGKEMEAAPNLIANARLAWAPSMLNGGRLQLEWSKLGSYWRDAENTGKYAGHDLLHLRMNYPVRKDIELYAAVNNVLDRKYAETASGTGTAPTYSAGLPRAMNIGAQLKW